MDDARQLMVASNENMPDSEHQQLGIQEALRSLGVEPHAGAKDTGPKLR